MDEASRPAPPAPRRLTLCAVLLATALACDSSAPTGPETAEPPKVVAFGDSLTAGPGLRPEETLPARLQERVNAAGYPHVVVNAGVSGDTTADAVARLDRALESGTVVLIVYDIALMPFLLAGVVGRVELNSRTAGIPTPPAPGSWPTTSGPTSSRSCDKGSIWVGRRP